MPSFSDQPFREDFAAACAKKWSIVTFLGSSVKPQFIDQIEAGIKKEMEPAASSSLSYR
jgi:hypothetical protein